MSWTEPPSSCRCGGTGADGCRPIEATIAIGIERLSGAIARDVADQRTFTPMVRRDLAASDTGVVEDSTSPVPDVAPERNRANQPALPSPGISDAEWDRLMTIMKEEGLA